MNEPGKYVLLKKVQPSSKNIKKAQKQKEKKLKKKIQKEQQKKVIAEIPKQRIGTSNQQFNEDTGIKKQKAKQKKQKGNAKETVNLKSKKNTQTKQSQPNSEHKGKNKNKNIDNVIPKISPTKTFGDDLSDRLKASRFRFINEQLYTQTGEQAIDVFKEDTSAFTAYHDGYRKQVEQWPINPLDRIVKSIKKL